MKPTICCDTNMSVPYLVPLPHQQIVLYSARSPKKTSNNEDTLAIIPIGGNTTILVLADGVGGISHGEQASKILVEELIAKLQKIKTTNKLEHVVLKTLAQVNKILISRGIATTVAVTICSPHVMRTYHAGDSAIMLFDKNGKLKTKTVMHSPVGYAFSAGRLNEQESLQHRDINIISNYVGYKNLYIESSNNIFYLPEDTLLMASDGLTDNLYLQEISDLICCKDILRGANTLIYECKRNMMENKPDRIRHPDDLSIIAFRNTPTTTA